MEHDLTLAGAEYVETRPEQGKCSFTLLTGAIASEAGLDGVKKILSTERFCKELDCTPLHRLHGHRHVGIGCNEDDRHLPVRSGKVALKLSPLRPGMRTSRTRQAGPPGGSALRERRCRMPGNASGPLPPPAVVAYGLGGKLLRDRGPSYAKRTNQPEI